MSSVLGFSKPYLEVIDLEKSQPKVIRVVEFPEQKLFKGYVCSLSNGKMSVLKVGGNKYRLFVIYNCDAIKEYNPKMYVVRQSYDLSTNTLTAANKSKDVYLLPTYDEKAILDVKAFLKAGRESAYVVMATRRQVEISKDPQNDAYYNLATAAES